MSFNGGSLPTQTFMDGYYLKLLKELSKNNVLSQRELAKRLGISLGRVNYALGGLVERGLIKVKRFKNSNNKSAYMYILTPQGIARKIELTREFLKKRITEYNSLQAEIEELKRELDK